MAGGRREEAVPSARRLLGSLRDLGYDFVSAVADLIDNCIAAGAGRVDVTIRFDGPDSWVRIADDGAGMAGNVLSEAMRLGADRDYGSEDLGKFGLGLKTASLSQCRLITVATRTSPSRKQIDCRQLDFDDVMQRDRWEILVPAAADRPKQATEPLENGPGTVVLWQVLDRVLSRQDPFGGWAERHLLGLAERLELHLGMVFGRFLSGKAKRSKKLVITINGNEIRPWDPFCQQEFVESLPVRELTVGPSLVRYTPFVLPPQRDFSTDEAWRNASGPLQWNRQQGFYIYRADRMIQSGGWSWVRGQDEHIKLARAGLEFWPELDENFEINISKMRVKLPEELRDQLRPLVTFLTRRADERYRLSARSDRRAKGPAPRTPPGARPSPATPLRSASGALSAVQATTPATAPATAPGPIWPARPGETLMTVADRLGLGSELDRIKSEIQKSEPEVAHELGW